MPLVVARHNAMDSMGVFSVRDILQRRQRVRPEASDMTGRCRLFVPGPSADEAPNRRITARPRGFVGIFLA